MKIFVTGGAGFIGANAAARWLRAGRQVVVLDNLSRARADENLAWLREGPNADALTFIEADVRDRAAVDAAVGAHADMDALVHLASQVAVTSSLAEPREDFESNVVGTFNLLEAVRTRRLDPVLILSSTNKVYGGLGDLTVAEDATRYRVPELPTGVGETRPLDFHSPYACSKGAAEQYWRDYHRIYGLRTTVLRQSCIYGPRQFGHADQGWVAWFAIAAMCGKPITVCGTGKQVRDFLYVDDLVDLYDALIRAPRPGEVYNVGGGPAFSLSLLEFLELLGDVLGGRVAHTFSDWRPGDQRVFVSDNTKVRQATGWAPATAPAEGVRRLVEWIRANRSLFG